MNYCERCGGRMNSGDWYDHCEFCGEDDEWTMNQPLDKEKVKCQNCGTEIYKVRRHCFICGAKNPAAFKKGSEYCVRCGNALENGVCPNCGKTKSQIRERAYKPEENGFCPVCGESVLFEDYFCSKCGAELYFDHPVKSYSKRTNNNTSVKTYSDFDSDEGWQSIGKEVNPTLWLVLGIVSLLLCFAPTSIGTIIFAAKAKKAKERGKSKTAEKYVGKAIRWFFAGIIISVILLVATLIFQLIG